LRRVAVRTEHLDDPLHQSPLSREGMGNFQAASAADKSATKAREFLE
jgi:hypothetical protein